MVFDKDQEYTGARFCGTIKNPLPEDGGCVNYIVDGILHGTCIMHGNYKAKIKRDRAVYVCVGAAWIVLCCGIYYIVPIHAGISGGKLEQGKNMEMSVDHDSRRPF